MYNLKAWIFFPDIESILFILVFTYNSSMGSFTNLFGNYPRVVILEAFAENPEYELSVPDLIKITQKSRRTVYMYIEKILEEGIIIEGKKEGKCQYYKFNSNDPRGEAFVFLEYILTKGSLEKEIKRDEEIPLHQPFPSVKYPTVNWRIVPEVEIKLPQDDMIPLLQSHSIEEIAKALTSLPSLPPLDEIVKVLATASLSMTSTADAIKKILESTSKVQDLDTIGNISSETTGGWHGIRSQSTSIHGYEAPFGNAT